MHTLWSDILFSLRFMSPFVLICALLAPACLTLYLITKWREFAMIGLTAGIYVIPFLHWGVYQRY